MRTAALRASGVIGSVVIASALVAGCADDPGGTGSGGGGPSSTSSSTSIATTSPASTTGGDGGAASSTGTAQGTGGSGGGGGASTGQGGFGPHECGDGEVVPGERCGFALGVGNLISEDGVAIVDLDEDGDGDLISSSRWLRNDGEGRFTSIELPFSVSGKPFPFDFDEDGHADVVYAGEDVGIAYGRGDGTFEEPSVLATLPGYGYCTGVGDLNQDGSWDIAVGTSDGAVVFYLSDGEGGFTVDEHPLTFTHIIDLQIGDLDGDGSDEVVAIEEYDVVDVWNDGDWTAHVWSAEVHESALADLDGDGDLDLAGVVQQPATIVIFPGDGEGGFLAPEHVELPIRARGMAAADFDLDGWIDFAVQTLPDYARDQDVRLLTFGWGSEAGFEVAEPVESACDTSALQVGDINGDGVPDLAASCRYDTTSAGPATTGGTGSGGAGGADGAPPGIGLWLSDP